MHGRRDTWSRLNQLIHDSALQARLEGTLAEAIAQKTKWETTFVDDSEKVRAASHLCLESYRPSSVSVYFAALLCLSRSSQLSQTCWVHRLGEPGLFSAPKLTDSAKVRAASHPQTDMDTRGNLSEVDSENISQETYRIAWVVDHEQTVLARRDRQR